jgi:hypothetical protein
MDQPGIKRGELTLAAAGEGVGRSPSWEAAIRQENAKFDLLVALAVSVQALMATHPVAIADSVPGDEMRELLSKLNEALDELLDASKPPHEGDQP